MTRFSIVNKNRCESPEGFRHTIGAWTAADWLTAISGELGEVATALFFLERVSTEQGLTGQSVAVQALADEIADVYTYLDLFGAAIGASIVPTMQAFREHLKPELFAVEAVAKSHGWTSGNWLIPVVAAIGECANATKKLRRLEMDIKNPGRESVTELLATRREALARAAMFLDRFSSSCGLPLPYIVVSKFERVSEKIGYPPQFTEELRSHRTDGTPKASKIVLPN